MSFDLPAGLEVELERYAKSEHISTGEAVVRLIADALRARNHETVAESTEWSTFRQLVPGVELFQRLPEGTVEAIAKTSRRIRAEKLTPRA
jgi:hypothetical protein